MASPVVAIQNGFEYQAYLFWTEAARLLIPKTNYHRVGFEIPGMKSFDDVAVTYFDPLPGPRKDERIIASYYQVKFKTDFSGLVSADCLLEPEFINAASESFLVKVKNAIEKKADPNKFVSFSLFTPWSIDPADALGKLVRGSHREFKKDYFMSGGPTSAMGKLRKKWANHLEVEDGDDLWKIVSTIRLDCGQASLERLKDKASLALQAAGLVPINMSKRADLYPSLIQKLHAQEHYEFDAGSLRKICQEEDLIVESAPARFNGKRLGVRSFSYFAESMETETDAMIDVVGLFDSRAIKDSGTWNSELKPKIAEFVSSESRGASAIQMHLDAHSSLAVAAGYFSNVKSKTENYVIQKTANKENVWKNSSVGVDPNLPKMSVMSRQDLNAAGKDQCFAVAISQMAFPEVAKFCAENVSSARCVSHVGMPIGSGSAVVVDGAHASALAEQTRDILKIARINMDSTAMLHLFISAPNSFSYFLGRLLTPLGNIRLYEYKFNEAWPELYRPSIDFP